MFDIFLSYGHDLKEQAFELLEKLEQKGLNCWIAPRNVTGTYASSIVEGIENSKVFVILLCKSSIESMHVLNEVEKAFNQLCEEKIHIIPYKCEECTYTGDMDYYLKRIQWVDGYTKSKEEAFDDLFNRIVDLIGYKKPSENDHERKNVQYLSEDDKFELKRLKIEEKLLYDYELPIYNRLFEGRTNLNVLDFNFLNAESSYRRLVRDEVNKVCCFGYNDYYVMESNAKYKDDPKIHFYKIDINEDDIEEKLQEVLEENKIESFNFVNLTMAILDFKNPYKVLKQIKKCLSKDAVFYVRDIDDTVVFAYPDENNLFSDIKKMYQDDKLSGSRESARQIYNIFKRLGASNIKLEYSGISTDQMNHDQKDMLFDAWFGFIPNDYKIMLKNDPRNQKLIEACAWLDDKFDDVEKEFHDDNFLFNSGYFIYTIKL